jgi:hypothetical protein
MALFCTLDFCVTRLYAHSVPFQELRRRDAHAPHPIPPVSNSITAAAAAAAAGRSGGVGLLGGGAGVLLDLLDMDSRVEAPVGQDGVGGARQRWGGRPASAVERRPQIAALVAVAAAAGAVPLVRPHSAR